jgi:ASC-1-like (ASCH) protein
MKYKIIGWTDYYDDNYPEHENVTDYVRHLIIDEIRKNGYLFGGDSHEDYCPVLNDGTLVSFSWRGWGGVMAEAWNIDDSSGMAYMFAYMDELIKPTARKYPKDGVNRHLIVDKSALVENFDFEIDDKLFSSLLQGERKINLHVSDEVRERIDMGDFVTLINKADKTKAKKFEVSDIDYFEPTFKMYLESSEYKESKQNGENNAETQRLDLNGNKIKSSEYDQYNYNYFKYCQKQNKEHYGDIQLHLKEIK